VKRAGFKCTCKCSGKECQLLRRGRQTKQLEMPVTVLPYVKNEQLLFVTLDFKPCKICNDWWKLLIERSDLVASRLVFLTAMLQIEQSSSDTSRILINSVLLCISQKFPRRRDPRFGSHWPKKLAICALKSMYHFHDLLKSHRTYCPQWLFSFLLK
jgi:hypothetical protein